MGARIDVTMLLLCGLPVADCLLAVHFQAAIAVQGSNGSVDFVAAAGGKVQAQGAEWAASSKLQGICTACGRISRVGGGRMMWLRLLSRHSQKE